MKKIETWGIEAAQKVTNMPRKRLLAILYEAVWKKVTKGRAGKWWNSVAERMWKNVGGTKTR